MVSSNCAANCSENISVNSPEVGSASAPCDSINTVSIVVVLGDHFTFNWNAVSGENANVAFRDK